MEGREFRTNFPLIRVTKIQGGKLKPFMGSVRMFERGQPARPKPPILKASGIFKKICRRISKT